MKFLESKKKIQKKSITNFQLGLLPLPLNNIFQGYFNKSFNFFQIVSVEQTLGKPLNDWNFPIGQISVPEEYLVCCPNMKLLAKAVHHERVAQRLELIQKIFNLKLLVCLTIDDVDNYVGKVLRYG